MGSRAHPNRLGIRGWVGGGRWGVFYPAAIAVFVSDDNDLFRFAGAIHLAAHDGNFQGQLFGSEPRFNILRYGGYVNLTSAAGGA